MQNRSVYILETTLLDALDYVLAASTFSDRLLVVVFTAKC